MKPSGHYDGETLSRYLDRELGPELAREVEAHAAACPECGARIRAFRSGDEAVRRWAEGAANAMDTHGIPVPDVSVRPGSLLKALVSGLPVRLTGKNFLQTGAIVAILLVAGIAVRHFTTETGGPSAIVTSVEGDTPSVMILETRKEHQTIIWFKES